MDYLQEFLKTSIQSEDYTGRHVLTLFALAHATKGKKYLELGVFDGLTTTPILLGAKLNGGHLTSVDIRKPNFVCPEELRPHWTFHQGDALEFLRNLDDSIVFDFVFIDDLHTYHQVQQEIALLEKHLTPSSIITLHDLMYDNTEPHYHTSPALPDTEWAEGGPYRAVNELPRRKWEWATLPWSNGLTILRKKGNVIDENPWNMRVKRWLRSFSPKLERYIVKKLNRRSHAA